MHSRPQARHTGRIWRISLEQIEATVSEFLGPRRVKGDSHKPTFSRHVSMCLARHVGGWSYPKISGFYNDRHYTTVVAAIRKIERLRATDESVDALREMLIATLSPESNPQYSRTARSRWRELIVEAATERVIAAMTDAHPGPSMSGTITGEAQGYRDARNSSGRDDR